MTYNLDILCRCFALLICLLIADIDFLLGFEELYISTSGLDITEHTHVERAVKQLGGRYHKDLEKGVTNLLITDRPSGPKFEHMARSRLPIIRMNWLQSCIEEVQHSLDSLDICGMRSTMMRGYDHVQERYPPHQ